jgi:hypothetical protein
MQIYFDLAITLKVLLILLPSLSIICNDSDGFGLLKAKHSIYVKALTLDKESTITNDALSLTKYSLCKYTDTDTAHIESH